MAKAKCKWCKAELDTKFALKIIANNKNSYYCNEEHYNLAKKAKAEQEKINQEYNQIYDITKEIFGYEFTGYPMLRKEIITWEKLATRQKIIAFLQENKNWLSRIMSKNFNNDYGRVRYYSVVVSGKLYDFKPQNDHKEITKSSEEHYETVYKSKVRVGLENFEENYDE